MPKHKIYTAYSGSHTPHYAGWAFIVCEPDGGLAINYCGCTEGTVALMQDMAIYQSLMWIKQRKVSFDDAIVFGSIAGSGLAKLIHELCPDLELQISPADEIKEFCEAKAEQGREVVQDAPVTLAEVNINDLLIRPEPLFSTRYLVIEKFATSILVQNISTVTKRLEAVFENKINLRKL